MCLPIFTISAQSLAHNFCSFFLLFPLFLIHHFSCNWRLDPGMSKILMKLLKIVWHCTRLYQFTVVDHCYPLLAFRLLKIGVRLSKILIVSIKIGLDCTRLGCFFCCFSTKITHYHQYLDQFLMDLLVTFTVGLIQLVQIDHLWMYQQGQKQLYFPHLNGLPAPLQVAALLKGVVNQCSLDNHVTQKWCHESYKWRDIARETSLSLQRSNITS